MRVLLHSRASCIDEDYLIVFREESSPRGTEGEYIVWQSLIWVVRN